MTLFPTTKPDDGVVFFDGTESTTDLRQDDEEGANLGNYGWVVLRLRANNPGAWLLHCHIGWHMIMGM